MADTIFIKADEVATTLGISKAQAYRLIRSWSKDLKEKGFTTMQGRVSRQYFKEQVYYAPSKEEEPSK